MNKMIKNILALMILTLNLNSFIFAGITAPKGDLDLQPREVYYVPVREVLPNGFVIIRMPGQGPITFGSVKILLLPSGREVEVSFRPGLTTWSELRERILNGFREIGVDEGSLQRVHLYDPQNPARVPDINSAARNNGIVDLRQGETLHLAR